jgi:Na+/proline symporter
LFFIVGLTAAAYSSADSALTALTTSFCVDFLQFGSKKATNTKVRTMVHIGFAILLYGVILLFREINNGAVIKELFMAAGLTYGPLLGLFFFGILMPHQINDRAVPWICIAAPILSYLIQKFSPSLFGGYQVGFELLPINGIITFTAIWLFSQNKSQEKHVEEDIIRP